MKALVLLAVLGGVDSLSKVTLGNLTFKAPNEWSHSDPDASSKQWESPGSEAELAMSVYPVEPSRPAKKCLDELLAAVGKEGFETLSVANQPAARKVTSDYVGEGDNAKTEENKVTTTTLLGCNGKTKWVLTWTAKTKEGPRYGPILKRVLESITYAGK